MLPWNGVEVRRGFGWSVAAQSAPTCIGFCRGGECAGCGSSGLPWPWWLYLWPHAAHCLRRGLGDRRGTCLSPLRSCKTDWSRFVACLKFTTVDSWNSGYMCPNNNICTSVTIQVFLVNLLLWFLGIFMGDIWKNAIPHFSPFILLHYFCTWHFYCLPICAVNLFLCPTPLFAPSAMFNYSGASCVLQFYLTLLESLSYLASEHFILDWLQIPEAWNRLSDKLWQVLIICNMHGHFPWLALSEHSPKNPVHSHAKCCLEASCTCRMRLHHKADNISKSSQKELMEILLVSSSQYLQNQVALNLKLGGEIGCLSCWQHMHAHAISPSVSLTHKYPKIGHVECWCWSLSQGALFLSIWLLANSWWEPVGERLGSE